MCGPRAGGALGGGGGGGCGVRVSPDNVQCPAPRPRVAGVLCRSLGAMTGQVSVSPALVGRRFAGSR